MTIHHHSKVNPLVNPVQEGDVIISESGERYQVKQNMVGAYWLVHIKSAHQLTQPVSGQVEICRAISELANI